MTVFENEINIERDAVNCEDDSFDGCFGYGLSHQSAVILVDGSTSMRRKTENGKSKLEICVDCVNGIPSSAAMKALTPLELARMDILTLSFKGEDVNVETPWMPMNLFEGVGKIKSGGSTPFYKALAIGIKCAMDRTRDCVTRGLSTRVTQIFMYTDGRAMDPEYREIAKELCRKYAAKGGKVKVFVVLVPGSMSEKTVKETAADIVDLCDNITVIKAANCVNGLPATFNFLAASLVVGASSTVGEDMKVQYDMKNMKVLSNTPVNNGLVSIGTQNF